MTVWIVIKYDCEDSYPEMAFVDRAKAVGYARERAEQIGIDTSDAKDYGEGDYDVGCFSVECVDLVYGL